MLNDMQEDVLINKFVYSGYKLEYTFSLYLSSYVALVVTETIVISLALYRTYEQRTVSIIDGS